jgi:hypothetical protein
MTLSISDTLHNNTMPCAECHYAQCRHAERRYAECRYAECRDAEPALGIHIFCLL